MTRLPISSIRLDGGTQIRTRLNEPALREYAERMQAGDAFPAVEVIHDESDYWLIDGFHRLQAATRAGMDSIDAEVRSGTKRDAVWLACAANRANGLRRSAADKRCAIEAALHHANGAQLSDGQIASHVGVDAKTVGKVRARLESTLEIPESSRRIGRDGRRTEVRRIGRNRLRLGRMGDDVAQPTPDQRQATPTDDVHVQVARESLCDLRVRADAVFAAAQPGATDRARLILAVAKFRDVLDAILGEGGER